MLSGIALYRVPRIGLNEVHGEAFLPCLQSLPWLGELLRESIRPRPGKACILFHKLMSMCFWQPSTHQELLLPFPAPLGPTLESPLVLEESGLLQVSDLNALSGAGLPRAPSWLPLRRD